MILFWAVSVFFLNDDLDGFGVLKKSTEAVKALNQFSYDYRYQGEGSLAGDFAGEVNMVWTQDGGDYYSKFKTVTPSKGVPPWDLEMTKIGNQAWLLNHADRSLHQGDLDQGNLFLVSLAAYTVFMQLFSEEPFEMELEYGNPTLGEDREIRGELCYTVKTLQVFGPIETEMWWFISKNNFLPLGQHWKSRNPEADGSFTFETWNLGVNQKRTIEPPQVPAGYNPVSQDTSGLKVGAPAPHFELPLAEGKTVSLKDLRGQVVVLDFWSSWCPNCWALKPDLLRIGQKWKGKPLVFLRINTWESPKVDPLKKVGKLDERHLLALHGENIALDYEIGALPGLFAVDPAGNLLFIWNGPGGDPVSGLEETLDHYFQSQNLP